MSDKNSSLINIEDIAGLSKPANTLIEKIAKATGIVFEPTRIKRKAEAEAEAEKIKTLASIEIKEIEQRAIDRLIYQESRKQKNIEEITIQAASALEEEDAKNIENIEEDWIAHFFKSCDTVSDKEMQSLWSSYVENDLLSRLHGFEILMASYAMCHLKIDLLLKETGYKPSNQEKPPRLNAYLTNALEESHKDYDTLFAFMYELSNEAKEASRIKNETPVMVAFGNPPYSVSSQNKGDWIQELIKDYKKNLNERKINLDDDYIKFIRMAEHYIEKTGYGVVAMITNNSFIDGITHRQMRKHLLETFDTIYIYDLHGSSKKNETAPDGSKDENVFDIMQGVSISILVKDNKNQGKLADVFHYDSYGRRKDKYQKLWDSNLDNVGFKKLEYKEPYYFFVPKDFELEEDYSKGLKVTDLFLNYSSGIHTGKDDLVIDIDLDKLKERISEVINTEDEVFIRNKYNLKDTSGWNLSRFKSTNNLDSSYSKLCFRPFDNRWIIYENKALKRDRFNIMKHSFDKQNLSLVTIRRSRSNKDWNFIFISNLMTTEPTTVTALDNNFNFPLYLYNTENTLDTKTRTPNLNQEIIEQISQKLNLPFITDHELEAADSKNNFSPLNLLDYIYAILHSPTYREKYKEFLKIDFPRVPYPSNQQTFWQLVKLGSELRQNHLLEGEKFEEIKNLITNYPIAGKNQVATINNKSFIVNADDPQTGKVYINDTQYFDNVPLIAWQFYIGGYQPAQKWLKDRKTRQLTHDDILHYQKIILALFETDRLMKEIDKIKL